MNREIKFRCYILDNNGNVEVYFNEWLDGDGWKHDYYAPLVTNGVFSHEELGDGFLGKIVRKQYTGLKDKNGVDSYDLDIINVTNNGIYNGNKVIVWDDILLCYVAVWLSIYNKWTNSQGGLTYLKISSGLKFEVIGNIYENSDLLSL